MRCLGIETSCDETALAIVDEGVVLASIMASQADLHALFGGVVPELASREHGRLIGPLYDLLLQKAGIDAASLDVIAFARGPGLLGSLLVGTAFAKALAVGLSRPIIGVNHLHAHLLAAGIEGELVYPALGLLVSGGHTHIYDIRSATEFIPLGRTIDDAAGEAFDKVGKLLGFPYPAGRIIDETAQRGRAVPDMFRCPYLANDNLDFSFSGLKTAATTVIAADPDLWAGKGDDTALADFCASLQEVIAETLKRKLARALDRTTGIRSLLLAGGVAANSAVRRAMTELAGERGLILSMPAPALCTDNGDMIAYTGWLLARQGAFHGLGVPCVPRGMPMPDDLIFTA